LLSGLAWFFIDADQPILSGELLAPEDPSRVGG